MEEQALEKFNNAIDAVLSRIKEQRRTMKNKYATIEADVVIKGERKKFSFSAEPKYNFNEFIVTEIATGRKTVAVSGDLVNNIRRLLHYLRSQGMVFNITECVSKWHNWADGSGTDFSFDTSKTDDYLKPLFKHEIAKRNNSL